MAATQKDSPVVTETPECFVMMPISDQEGYPKGHFRRVYEDIFIPACNKAGFRAVIASDVAESNMIHLDILQRILQSPMSLCDLSTRNPNVLFELGLRQAFDKPVVLVREVNTPSIFDIAPLRYTEYRKDRIYDEVLQDQDKIAKAIQATQEASQKGEGVNSIVRLLSLTQPASLPDVQEADRDPVLQIIRAELNALRSEFRKNLEEFETRRLLGLAETEASALGIKTSRAPTISQSEAERIIRDSVQMGVPVSTIIDFLATYNISERWVKLKIPAVAAALKAEATVRKTENEDDDTDVDDIPF
jgi:hypothetical protein